MSGAAQSPSPASGPVRDRLGRIFDAVKFRLGLDGQPRFDVLGRFVNRRGGRKPKPKMENPPSEPANPAQPVTVPGAALPGPSQIPAPDFSDVEKAMKSAPAGEGGDNPSPTTAEELAEAVSVIGDNPTADTVIGLIQTGLMLIGGDEGILSSFEKTMLRRPLVRVLEKYNVGTNALPAEVDLVLAVLGLVASRLQKPKTAAFALKVKAWVVEKWFSFRGARMANKLAADAADTKAGAS